MTALQSISPATLRSPFEQPPPRSSLRVVRSRNRSESKPLTLEQQGVRADWFRRAVDESNCALFHASLFPLLPQLRDVVRRWLRANSADPSLANDSVIVGCFVTDVVVFAFEQRCHWRSDEPMLDWLASFVPIACKEREPA